MILLNKEARAELKKGIDILADAVRVTLGPKEETLLSIRTKDHS